MVITCVGDSGVDYYVDHNLLRPGGITLNFAVHARKVFPKSDTIRVVSPVGSDKEARMVKTTIKQYHLDLCITRCTGKTPIQYIDHDDRGEKQFVKYEEGVLADFVVGAKEKKRIRQSDFVIAVIYDQIEGFFDSVVQCETDGLMAVDFMDLADYGKKATIVKKYIERFDIGFFGLRLSDKKLLKELKKLASKHKKLFVITLGPDGSLVYQGDKEFFEPAVEVAEIIDTTGAGDAFAAAFVKEYLYSHDVKKSLKAGNKRAAKVVQALGSF